MSEYKLVPVEPTKEQIEEFKSMWTKGFCDDQMARNCYKAFMDAAPAAQQPDNSAAVCMDKQCREDVAAVLGFVRGGNYAWSYLLQQIKEITSAEGKQPTPDVSALVEALESIMGYIPLDVVHCRGDRCRELWCASCFRDEEAESYLVTAERHLKNAKSAIAAYRKGEGAQP